MFANKKDSETTIVIGLVIFIVMVIMYNKSQKAPCDKYVTHFDKMYYDLPIINTKYQQPDDVEGLNDMSQYIMNKAKPLMSEFDTAKQRWAGNGDSQPGTDGMGRRDNFFGDLQSIPDRLGLSNLIPGPTNLPTHTERFADDDYLNQDFSYNKKYKYAPGMDDYVDENNDGIDDSYINKDFNKLRNQPRL